MGAKKGLLIGLTLLCIFAGCNSFRKQQYMITDHEDYEDGTIKKYSYGGTVEKGWYMCEYYPNGHLKSMEMKLDSRICYRLTFYENGMLKCEQRFRGNHSTVYYDQEGNIVILPRLM